MKATLIKQMGLLGMLVFFLYQAYASLPSTKNKLLLSDSLYESMAKNSTVKNEVPATVIPLQPAIKNHVEKYLAENAEMLQQIKEQKSATCKTIQTILVKRGVPAGLLYLAIVESDLKNSATSKVGAAGIWQMMPGTARWLGLQVNGKTDQRRHMYKSSVAAADYLSQLYKQFDDWLLVVAAYNCGAGNIEKAIKLSGSREFWKMQRYLPAETRNHVKHFIATHFYYEENGSIVTLTKKERMLYLASLNEMVIKNDALKNSEEAATFHQPANEALVEGQEGELNVDLKRF